MGFEGNSMYVLDLPEEHPIIKNVKTKTKTNSGKLKGFIIFVPNSNFCISIISEKRFARKKS